ncbi:Extended synaptotagmin-like protein 2 [Carabus blaptoides fortunei]
MADSSESDIKKALIPKRVGGVSVSTMLYSLFKKISTVGIVYFVGYMHWSVAWFICPVVLLAIRDQWREEHELKRNIAKATAMSTEKEVILARVDDLPAWVFFPDVERSIPPRVGGVKVYERNISRNEIIMDLDIFYAGDCEITFSLAGVRGGIKDFQLHGMVRVVMKPLITVMPIVGGLQIFFLNNPTIEFNLVGIADVLDMPGLSDILRKIIIEQVASMMVLPNKFPIKLSDIVEAATLKIPEPEGVLRVHVVEAKHLMKKDISMLGKGKSDPYAVINVGAQEFKTKTINNTVDPKWDYWCEFTVLESNGQQMFIHLWDSDDLPKDDEPLGRATVEISNVVKQGQVDTWITLEQAKHGMVHLRMTWLKLTAAYSDLKAALMETQQLRVTTMSTAILTVFIDSAKHLPQIRAASKPDPYVVISVGKITRQTATHMRTCDPVWEQGFTFLSQNPESDTVVDQKTSSDLGVFSYNLSQFSTKGNLELESQPYGLLRGGPDTKLILAMKLRVLKYDNPVELMQNDGETVSEHAPLLRTESSLSTTSSKSSVASPNKKEITREPSIKSIGQNSVAESVAESEVIAEEPMQDTIIPAVNATPPDSPHAGLHLRTPSVTSNAGEAGLGRIRLTLRYSVQRQILVIVVLKVANLPLKDPSNIPDPYIKLYLLPERVKDSKRKTKVIKDNCNPVYDETFEYLMSQGELNTRQLEVTVVTQKRLFSSGSNIMGQVLIDLSQYDLTQPYTDWFDLQPEIPREY